MNKRKRIETVFLYVAFTCYILFLIKLLFLSRVSHGQDTLNRSINIIPFNSIKEYIFSNSATIKRFAFSNVGGNILIFIPLGTYLTLFKNNKKVISNMLFIFIASLSIEIVQGFLAIGASDIDDIILNCLGGLVGILGYKLLLFILRNEKRVRFVITIISAMGLPVLFYLSFMIRLRL